MGTALRDRITGDLIIEWRNDPPPGVVVGEQHELVETPAYPTGILRWEPPYRPGETLAERRRYAEWTDSEPRERPWLYGPGGLLDRRWRTGSEATEAAREIAAFDEVWRAEYDRAYWRRPQA